MTNEQIRNQVRNAAPSTQAIWPNGLGYNCRGWEYSLSEKGWAAIPANSDPEDTRLGRGATPLAAIRNAQGQVCCDNCGTALEKVAEAKHECKNCGAVWIEKSGCLQYGKAS